jgi:hypothetical protein|nr:MAG TPA: putative nucleotide-binding protein [Caudoviricetes sp.]
MEDDKKYYHILFIFKNGDEDFKTDILDKDKVINNIVIPYINHEKEKIVMGKKINFNNLKEIQIIYSEWPIKFLIGSLQIEFNKEADGILIIPQTVNELFILRSSKQKINDITGSMKTYNITDEIVEEAENMLGNEINKNGNRITIIEEKNSDKIFIVHGHDNSAKNELARFIERIGLKAIILHEQASGGNTIIEKIEEYANTVGFAIILYTACDKGKSKKEDDLKDRARQNVVFEHGYFVGKLGRNRVIALNKENIETPSDINGVLYILMDSVGAWKTQIVQELKNAGYTIDANNIF